MTDSTSPDNNDHDDGYLNKIYNLFKDYKNYILVCLCIVVIIYIVYNFYFKKKINSNKLYKPILELPKSNNISDNPDYIILDKKGNPIKVTSNFFNSLNLKHNLDITDHSSICSAEIVNKLEKLQNNSKINIDQANQSNNNISSESPSRSYPNKSSDAPKYRKIQHPNFNDDDNSSDINNELARIKADENINISRHNLTNSELEDINNKLNMIQK